MAIRGNLIINREVEEASRTSLGNKETSSKSLEEVDILKEDSEGDKMLIKAGSRTRVV